MDIRKKNLFTISALMTQNSAPTETIRPDELQKELGIKKDAYYKDVDYLDLVVDTDSEGRVYLTKEQADQIRALRNHVKNTGKREGFNNSSIVKVDDSNELVSNNNEAESEIYINRQEPTANLDSRIVREAEELAARGMAMNDLIKIQLASQMSFEDLSPDLQEKVNIAREVANPKFTPAAIAQQLLAQHRSQKTQVEG
jgi:hypothetical protein